MRVDFLKKTRILKIQQKTNNPPQKEKAKMKTQKSKTYNHAFTISFSVRGSKYANPNHCVKKEKQKIINALHAHVRNIFCDKDYVHFLDPYDTAEEV